MPSLPAFKKYIFLDTSLYLRSKAKSKLYRTRRAWLLHFSSICIAPASDKIYLCLCAKTRRRRREQGIREAPVPASTVRVHVSFFAFSLTLMQSRVHFQHHRVCGFQPTDENIFFDTLRAVETRSRSYGDLVSKMGLLSPIFQKP